MIYYIFSPTLGARDFSSAVSGFCQVFIVAEDVSAFGQHAHRKFPPHARKTSGTQGTLALEKCKKNAIFFWNYSGTRFLSTEN